MNEFAALTPVLTVTLAACGVMLAEAFRPKGDRMPVELLALIGFAGAAVSSVFLWDHETHETSIEAPDLDSFISEWKKWEAEARTLREREQPKQDQLEKQILMSFCLVGSSILFIVIMIIVALLQGRGR